MSEKELSQVYLFDGADVLKREMLLERLIKRIGSPDELSMNSAILAAKDVKTPARLLDALNTMPFGSRYRLVVIQDAEQLDKAVQAALVDYLGRPSDTTVLVLTSDKLPINTRLFKAIKERFAASIIDCSQKKRYELPQLIRNIAKSEGVDISTTAANLMLDRLGTDTVLLNNETRKLAAIVRALGKKSISDKDVGEYVMLRTEPKHWDLTNALALKDLPLCLKYVDSMKSFTAVGLFSFCVARIREILSAKVIRARGQSVAKALNKQDWQIKELLRGAELFSYDELETLLRQAPEIEKSMKSGADADQVLRLWIIDACTWKSSALH